MRKPGFIQPRKAAKILGVHPNTVYQYIGRKEAGEPSPIKTVERNPETGYCWLSLAEIKALAGKGGGV